MGDYAGCERSVDNRVLDHRQGVEVSIRAVSFDCAGTLVEVNWNPAALAVESALLSGLSVPDDALHKYAAILRNRWDSYHEMNLQRSKAASDEWWKEMTREWCEAVGIGEHSEQVHETALQRMYVSEHARFDLFDDAMPALDLARNKGLKVAALSNWDVSLHSVLQRLKIYDRFDVVLASLEEGIEKPEPEFFEIMRAALDLEADEILHIGDDPIDDLRGARGAGMKSALIDRRRAESNAPYLCSLTDIDKAIEWNS